MNTIQQSGSSNNAAQMSSLVSTLSQSSITDWPSSSDISIVIYPWQWPGIKFNDKPWIYVSTHDNKTSVYEGGKYGPIH